MECKCNRVHCNKCNEFKTNSTDKKAKPHTGLQVKTEAIDYEAQRSYKSDSTAEADLPLKPDYDHPNFLYVNQYNSQQDMQALCWVRGHPEPLGKHRATSYIKDYRSTSSSRRRRVKLKTGATLAKDPLGAAHALKCLICGWRAATMQELNMHIYTHIDDVKYICLICYSLHRSKAALEHHIVSDHRSRTTQDDKSFRTPMSVKKHERTHNVKRSFGNRQLECRICSKQYNHAAKLKAHVRANHRGERKQCQICHQQFRTTKYFNRHMHIKHDVLASGLCNVCYEDASQESAHTCASEKQGSYECDICHKQYAAKSYFTLHMRLHAGDTPHECDICNKRFLNLARLTLHKRSHTDEKPFKCDICHKRYTQQSSLTIHNRLHTGERPHKCDVCSKTFIKTSYLILHKRSHTDERKYECSVCHKRFKAASALNLHKIIHTGEKYKCDVCPKEFSQKSYLVAHQRKHNNNEPFLCEICSKRFTVKGHLNEHMRTHEGHKPFQCETCQKRFSRGTALKRHIMVHTGEKPYKCDICHKQFNDPCNLLKHTNIHNR